VHIHPVSLLLGCQYVPSHSRVCDAYRTPNHWPLPFATPRQAAAPVNCPLWQSGKQTFILNFTLSPKASPVVNGGSLYASGCEDGNVDARGTIKSISKAQMQCGAGTGMYGVTTGDNSARCMAWDATCKQVFYEFWEYDPAGECWRNRGRQCLKLWQKDIVCLKCTP
jgi:hypothetical protein